MCGPWINQVRPAQLANPPQALEGRMGDDLPLLVVESNEPMHRTADFVKTMPISHVIARRTLCCSTSTILSSTVESFVHHREVIVAIGTCSRQGKKVSDPPYPTPSPVILLRVPIIRPETNHGHHLPPFLPSSSPAHPLPTAPVIPNPSILPPGSMVPRTEGKHLRFLLRLPGRTKWSDLYASLTLLGCGIPDAPPTGRRTYFPLAGRGRRCVPHIRD